MLCHDFVGNIYYHHTKENATLNVYGESELMHNLLKYNFTFKNFTTTFAKCFK